MSLLARVALALLVVGSAATLARWSDAQLPRSTQLPRWFTPGALGFEPGRGTAPPPPPGPSAFLTRTLTGLLEPRARLWGQRNDLTPKLNFTHSLKDIFPPALFATHPEYFPLADGKRLNPPRGTEFWNPDIARADVAAVAAAAARAYFDRHPTALSFALGTNDGLLFGESPELLALVTPTQWFRERPDYSPLVHTFMNRVAADLARTHPQKLLGSLAYYWSENLPPFPLHPQVVPYVTADRSQGYDRAFWSEEMTQQTEWGRLAGRPADAISTRRLGLYDYIYGSGFLIPRIHTRLLAESLRHARRAGFTDYYAEVNPNWGLDGPMPWLTTQLLRDPEQDPAALLTEFYTRYFQETSVPMRRFFERCEELWLTQPGPAYWLKHYRNESQAVVFPPAACRELRALLDEATRLARTRKIADRVELVSATFGVTERFVTFHTTRAELTRAALRPATEPARLAALLTDYLAQRTEFIRYTLALRQREPLTLFPFDATDYLKNDPLPLALSALQRSATRPADLSAPQAMPALQHLAAHPLVAPLWPRLLAGPATIPAAPAPRELLYDAALQGPLQPPRTVAGLPYGVALPPGWLSRVEPAQHHRAERLTRDGKNVLRLTGTKDTMISQWARVVPGELHTATLAVRGHVSPGTAVTLVLSFLNEAHRHVGVKMVRLPDGAWPEWATLRQAAVPPPGAAWVGMGVRVLNQVPGDWTEAADFSLTAPAAR